MARKTTNKGDGMNTIDQLVEKLAAEKVAEIRGKVEARGSELLGTPAKKRGGRPKGSKNQPKVQAAPKRKGGRPKGSKNKAKAANPTIMEQLEKLVNGTSAVPNGA